MAREVSPRAPSSQIPGICSGNRGSLPGAWTWTLSSGLQGARGSKLRPWSHHRWIRHLGCSQSGTSLPQRLACRGLRQAAPRVSILRSRAGHTRGGSWGAEVKNTTKPSPSARPRGWKWDPSRQPPPAHPSTAPGTLVLAKWLGWGWEEGMGHRGQRRLGPSPRPRPCLLGPQPQDRGSWLRSPQVQCHWPLCRLEPFCCFSSPVLFATARLPGGARVCAAPGAFATSGQ